ncbi:MAG: LysR family transcriptional regulator [Solobacterium sp.]|nr:LysR family transcriptional regulator [Solobacterium sp.]
MELKQLEYFLAVADAGSISEAARLLHMTQPPLSVQMKLLENEIGTDLFIRSHRRTVLTDAGKKLYEHARIILELTESAVKETADTGKYHTLRIGMTPTTMPVLLPYLTALKQSDASVRYEIYDNNTFLLKELLANNQLDAAAVRTPISLPGRDTFVLKEDRMLGAASVNLPSSLTLAELASYPLILYRRYYEVVMSAFRSHELNPHIFAVCDDARTALELARGTEAVAVVPESMRAHCGDHSVAVIDEKSLETEILFVYTESSVSPQLRQLIDLIRADQ